MRSSFESHWLDELEQLERESRRRTLRPVEWRSAREILLGGRSLLNFSSNDYLGLSTHPGVIAAAREALERYGAGSGASRLVSGNLTLYSRLEEQLARIKNTEAALIFPSGYHANLGLIPALVGPEDTVVVDRLAHASLVDGARLSRARLKVFPHNDARALEGLLKQISKRKTLVLTESVFSMDGDVAPADELLKVCEAQDALLVLDDAHGLGVIGKTGRGVQEAFALRSPQLIVMGTLSKAMGALGGYVAGSRPLIDFLVNRARTLIYTTALPPATLASASAAVEIAFETPEGAALHEKLCENIAALRSGLRERGYPVGKDGTAILPVIVGQEEKALNLAEALYEEGIFAPAIRPPTVPAGTARLRLSLSALHQEEDLQRLLDVLPAAGASPAQHRQSGGNPRPLRR